MYVYIYVYVYIYIHTHKNRMEHWVGCAFPCNYLNHFQHFFRRDIHSFTLSGGYVYMYVSMYRLKVGEISELHLIYLCI